MCAASASRRTWTAPPRLPWIHLSRSYLGLARVPPRMRFAVSNLGGLPFGHNASTCSSVMESTTSRASSRIKPLRISSSRLSRSTAIFASSRESPSCRILRSMSIS